LGVNIPDAGNRKRRAERRVRRALFPSKPEKLAQQFVDCSIIGAGFAAAMTAAVHHATGVRVRELPIKIEDLLA
jgi:hypothetical protein